MFCILSSPAIDVTPWFAGAHPVFGTPFKEFRSQHAVAVARALGRVRHTPAVKCYWHAQSVVTVTFVSSCGIANQVNDTSARRFSS
jgi:hypothetical protein